MRDVSLRDLVDQEILDISDGYRTRRDQLDPTGIPILRVADMSDGSLTPATGDRVSPAYLPRMGIKTSRDHDVLVSTKGTVGRVARVPEKFPLHVYSPQLCFLRSLEPNAVDPSWLYCWARSPEFLNQVLVFSGQTDMAPYLSLRDLYSIRMRLPPLDEQRRIAGVLGALDDLIEVNRTLISDLESSAYARFLKVVSAGGAQLETCSLASTVEVISGGTPKTSEPSFWGGGIPWFSVVDVPATSEAWVLSTEKSITDEGLNRSAAKLISPGATVLTARGTVGKTALVGVPMAINQSCYALECRTSKRGYFNLYRVRSAVEALQRMSHGSVFSTITRGTLESVQIPSVSAQDIRTFDEEVDPFFQQIKALLEENRDLSNCRDELLPLLLSGRVRVGDVAA